MLSKLGCEGCLERAWRAWAGSGSALLTAPPPHGWGEYPATQGPTSEPTLLKNSPVSFNKMASRSPILTSRSPKATFRATRKTPRSPESRDRRPGRYSMDPNGQIIRKSRCHFHPPDLSTSRGARGVTRSEKRPGRGQLCRYLRHSRLRIAPKHGSR